jgi:hypothetical protein
MDFAGKLGEILGGVADKAVDVTSRVRYGVSPEEKQRLMLSRELPGAPSYLEDPAASERYASTFLGSKKWGKLPTEVFNALAFSDIGQGPAGAARKAVGASGAEAGDMASQIEERARQERLKRLFAGQR